jgi:hypothetical protein
MAQPENEGVGADGDGNEADRLIPGGLAGRGGGSIQKGGGGSIQKGGGGAGGGVASPGPSTTIHFPASYQGTSAVASPRSAESDV